MVLRARAVAKATLLFAGLLTGLLSGCEDNPASGCPTGEQDNDGNGTCLPMCATDGSSCSNHGACDDSSGIAVCTCDNGYTGTDCSTVDCTGVDCGEGTCDASGAAPVCTCNNGFQDNDGDLTCTPACATGGLSCSNRGTCSDTTGTFMCTCEPGYGGADCSTVDCSGVDCGSGTCDSSGSAPTCDCDEGFQDNDDDLTCAPGCAGDGSSCSNHGTCEDDTGAIVCDCDTGYTGADCASCAVGFVPDGSECATPIRGALTVGDPGMFADGFVPASCQDYRNPPAGYTYQGSTGDGVYLIDPYDNGAFEVNCDQTTGGGGYAVVDAARIAASFRRSLNELDNTCSLNGANPVGTDTTDGHHCQYDVDVGFAFNEIRTWAFEITSRSVGADTTDVVFWSGDWGASAGACGGTGDFRIGAADASGPVISLGQSLGLPECSTFRELAAGEVVALDAQGLLAADSTQLRIEMDESGGQSEGWEWTGGGFLLRRNDHTITGLLTQADPGRYDDGSAAQSCTEIADGRFSNDQFYAGTPTSGWFQIDDDGDAGTAPIVQFCDQGDELVPELAWDRAADPTTHTVNSLLAGVVNELDPAPANVSIMGELVEEATSILWSDVDASFDVQSLRVDLTGNTSTEVAVDIDYFGFSQEESAAFIFATGASGDTNILCFEDAVAGNTDYTAEEQALVPYACANGGGNVTWNGLFRIDIGEPVQSVTFRSFQGDITRGDFSRLSRFNVFVP